MKSVSTCTLSGCRKCQIPGNTLPCSHMMFREVGNSITLKMVEKDHVRYVHDMLCAPMLNVTGHECTALFKEQPPR
eukprot:208488-Pelagomonas_calceolata.AAC.1